MSAATASVSLYQAISVKYLGPTNTKGARLKASAISGPSVTISRDSSQRIDASYCKAVRALCEKLSWDGQWIGSSIKDGMVFVCVDYHQEPKGATS